MLKLLHASETCVVRVDKIESISLEGETIKIFTRAAYIDLPVPEHQDANECFKALVEKWNDVLNADNS